MDLAVLSLLDLPDEATLTLVGSGNDVYLASLRRLVSERVLTIASTSIAGAALSSPMLYADADVILFPVRWDEPFGLVPLEAMAVGRPVVATGRGWIWRVLGGRSELPHL